MATFAEIATRWDSDEGSSSHLGVPRAIPAASPPAILEVAGGRETHRAYEVEPTLCHDGFHRGFAGRTYQMFWLHTSGRGHWCVGGREAGKFMTRDEAEALGRFWVETGRDTSSAIGKRMFQEWLGSARQEMAA